MKKTRIEFKDRRRIIHKLFVNEKAVIIGGNEAFGETKK
jgi:hypothetical protein